MNLPTTNNYTRSIRQPLHTLYNQALVKPDAHHQAEVYCRDHAFAQEDQQQADKHTTEVAMVSKILAYSPTTSDTTSFHQGGWSSTDFVSKDSKSKDDPHQSDWFRKFAYHLNPEAYGH